METGIGAAWASGEMPPWMQPQPWFDEAEAADRAELADMLRIDLLAERFGPLDHLAAERDRPPLPLPAARPTTADGPAVYVRRRAILERALPPTDHPAAADARWAA